MPDHNLNRLANIIAEVVMTLGIDVGYCNLGPGPDICALGDEAVAALKSRLGGTPSGRAEELITQLEAEIVRRDARIVEQAREIDRLRRSAQTNWNEFADGMKAQPSAGAVDGGEARHDAVKALHDVMEAVPCSSLYSMAEAVLDAGYSLNPCRAQAVQTVPDGKICVTTTALYEVLYALVNAPHQIRELQATREPAELFADNPINVLVAEYKAAQQKESGDE